jgi:hypothetical protein
MVFTVEYIAGRRVSPKVAKGNIWLLGSNDGNGTVGLAASEPAGHVCYAPPPRVNPRGPVV